MRTDDDWTRVVGRGETNRFTRHFGEKPTEYFDELYIGQERKRRIED